MVPTETRMNATDVEILRTIRREMGKRPIDFTRLDLQVCNGRVTLGGSVTRRREHPTVDVKSEVDMLIKIITRDRLIKEVGNSIRVFQEEDTKNDHDSRGRVRG